MVVERRQRTCEREVVHVERLAHAVEQVDHLAAPHAVTDAQTRQAIDLGKSPDHQQVGKVLDPCHRVGAIGRCQVFRIGLVEDDRDMRRNFLDEGAHFGLRQEVAGRIVGVGDPHHMRVGPDRRQHGGRVMAVVLRRRGDALGARRHRGQRIHGEGMPGKHGGTARCEENPGRQVEHVVRTIAQHHLLLRHAMAFGDRRDQLELVRVTLDAAIYANERRLDRLARLRTHAQRVFVGGQLDDLLDRNPHLAGQFGDRLAGNVRRNGADVRGCLLDDAHEGPFSKRPWDRSPGS